MSVKEGKKGEELLIDLGGGDGGVWRSGKRLV